MAQMTYNAQTGRYEGDALTVDGDILAEVAQTLRAELIAGGMDEEAAAESAFTESALESAWTLDMDGVLPR